MSWRNAKALDVLKAEITAKYPGRANGSLQTIGDPNHSSRVSQHNPNAAGVVTAIDVMNDKHGPDPDAFCKYLVWLGKSGDPRIWYVVWDRHIYSYTYGWSKRNYTGADPHTSHVHMSLRQTPAAYDSTASWGIKAGQPAPGDDDMDPKTMIKSTVWAESVTGWDEQQLQVILSRTQARVTQANNNAAAALALVKKMAATMLTPDQVKEALAEAIEENIEIDVDVTLTPRGD